MEFSHDQWYALCGEHKSLTGGLEGIIKKHDGDERCDFIHKKKRCKGQAMWEWYGGKELAD